MIKIIPLVFVIFFYARSSAQDFNYYKAIESTGAIPEGFRTLSSEKYEEAVANMSKKEKRFERKAKEQFYLESSFLIDELLLSGRVLFNDTITNYVNRVAKQVLKSEKGLYEKLQIYVVNSSAVNAFATNNGIIFINMGLLAKLNSEAQLAFIICHEAIHFKEKHVIKSYVQREKVDKDPGLFKNRPSLDDRLMAKSNYSIQNELKADKHGLEIYLKSDYNPRAAMEVFSLLHTAYLPMEEQQPFDIDFFKSAYIEYDSTVLLQNYFPTPDELFKDKKKDEEESEEPEMATHPKIGDRILQAEEIIGKDHTTAGADFILSKDAFETINTMARFELCRLFLLDRRYERSLYLAYNLLAEYPNSYYLKSVIMKSIYGVSRLHEGNEYGEVMIKVKSNPKTIQPYSNFLRELSSLESNILATEHILPLLQENGDDHAHQLILGQMMDQQIEELESSRKLKTVDSTMILDSVLVRFKKDFPLYASYFKKRIEKKESESRKRQLREMLVLDPVVYKIDLRNDNPISYLDSEKSQVAFNEHVNDCAKAAGIKVTMAKTMDLQKEATQEFNDVRFLKRFREDKFENEVDIVSVDHNRCMEISNRYGIKDMAFIGSFEIREKKAGIALVLLGTLFYLPLLPYGIAYAVTPERGYLNSVIVFNIEEDDVKTSSYHIKKSTDSKANVRSSLYYNFINIK